MRPPQHREAEPERAGESEGAGPRCKPRSFRRSGFFREPQRTQTTPAMPARSHPAMAALCFLRWPEFHCA